MKIIIKELAINYLDIGSGPVVVVLHGWGTSSDDMKPVYDHLLKHFRVIVPDLPGFGSSEAPKSDWTIGDYASFVSDLLNKLNIDSVYCLIGHSFGGRITIKSAGDGTLNPEKIVLIGSAGVIHSNSVRNTIFKYVAKVGKLVFSIPGLGRFSDSAKSRLYKSAGSSDYLNAKNMSAIFANTIKEDLRAAAAKINQPSLLIWGADDYIAPVSDGKIFNKLIKGSQLIIIDGAGHFVHSDQTQKVQQELDKFL